VNTRQLRYFLALIDQRSFAGAAEALSVSQQAVSKTLRELETQLGVRLFERSAHGMSPTAQATKLEVHARAIFAQLRLARAELSPGASERGVMVSVGFGISVPEHVVSHAINRFRELSPAVGVRAHSQTTGELQRKLLDGDLDLFLSAPPEEFQFAADLAIEQVAMERDQIIVRSTHPLARRGHVTLAELRDSPWILSSVRDAGWTRVCDEFEREGLAPPESVVLTNSMMVGRGLIQSDDYIALGNCHMHQSELERGAVVVLSVPALEFRRPVVIGSSRSRPGGSAVATMVNCLRDASSNYD